MYTEEDLEAAFFEGANPETYGFKSWLNSIYKKEITGKPISISSAKRIAMENGYTQVIIHAFDGATGIQHVTTYGKSLSDCANAAEGGNQIKKLLGWGIPDAVPARVLKDRNNKTQIIDDTGTKIGSQG